MQQPLQQLTTSAALMIEFERIKVTHVQECMKWVRNMSMWWEQPILTKISPWSKTNFPFHDKQ